MEFRTLAEGLQFPEGPVALPDGWAVLVEIAAGTLTRIAPDGTKSVVATTGGGPNGAAIGPDGKCYVANNGGFEWHREEGRIRPLTQACDQQFQHGDAQPGTETDRRGAAGQRHSRS